MTPQPVACTIAGSDSGGGAGIQADIKTFDACGVFGTSVLVAVTAQNTVGVSAVEAVSAGMVAAQLDAVATDLGPAAWKTGMLLDATTIGVVARGLMRHNATNIVVDPVMVAKSGDRLLHPRAVDALRTELLPLAAVLTPNIPEAETLTGTALSDPGATREAAESLARLGPRIVVVKGGHAAGDDVVDVVFDAETGGFFELTYPRVGGTSTHGTGCTLSAAIAAFLARGVAPLDAIASARAYLQYALARAPGLGRGHGPLGHADRVNAAPVVRMDAGT